MEFTLLSGHSLDFQQVTCKTVPMTFSLALVMLDKLSSAKVESTAQSGSQLPWSVFLENSLEKHTVAVQQETGEPVSRCIQVQIFHGDVSETKASKSGFMRTIDNYSNEKQFGIFGQLLSVSGGRDNVAVDLTLEFGTDKDKMKIDLKDKRFSRYETKNAHEVTHWFDFTDSMAQIWSGNSKAPGTLTIKLHLSDQALKLIRLDELKGSPFRMLRKMLEDSPDTGDCNLVTWNGSLIPCHKAV